MYQISNRLTMAGAFLSLACGFLLTQQPTKAATTSQAATPTTQVVKADSNVLGQGVDGTCKWDIVKDGDEGVLTIHAGQLDPGNLGNLDEIANYYLRREITKVVIDPDVIASKDSSGLFNSFYNAKEFVGLSNLNTSQVTNMAYMFEGCGAKGLDLSNWDTSKVTDMNSMFAGCTNLEKINLKSFNTKNVTNMIQMFFQCNKLRKLDLSSFETPKLKKANEMFGGDAHSIDYVDMRNFDNSQAGGIFDMGYICKLTVGPKLTNEDFPEPMVGQIFDDNGIKKVETDQYWIALNGPDKGVKKASWEMHYVKRDQPVTYIIENKALTNSYTEYKTVTRTIKIHPNINFLFVTEPVIFTQKATIHRQVTINDDGTKTYGEWSKDYWEEYDAPAPNWTNPDDYKVDKQIVDGNTQDQTVDIHY
ncbi:BspA family leucine-rich repeat surface protein [Bombilactobacillus mellis]|uniref:BspA family leucine-rich repeat surface protein n=1 Tax=Bombilactobacillus mellis TaxID=1218508 RepID=UPI0022453D64|nr:BspA family leucine-rich repeat surface protein [Bombilactobacillus mellis]MCX0279916.1 BspA family leucine-rich repeat surface protein [Bombilactobacillus mellis]